MMYTEQITDLITVYGDFARVEGAAIPTEDGCTYRNADVELTSKTEKHPSGVCIRRDTVKNVSDRVITVSVALSRFTLNGGEYQVYTQTSKHICEGIGAWQSLVTGVYGASDEIRTNQDVNPFVAVYNEQSRRGLAFHILCDSAFEYSVTRHGEFLAPKVVLVELGIRSRDFQYTLAPGETLAMPAILYYTFESTLDMDAYKLHRYYNEIHKTRLPIVYNTWMSHFDRVGFEELTDQLDRAARLGCEYFTVDAGWFGKTQLWWDVVGDWKESEESAMGGHLREFSDMVRAKGLKFGLWFEIERANPACENVKSHPDYYLMDGPHAYVDFANPAACDFIYGILKGNIDRYGVEFIKFDLNGPLSYDKSRTAFLKYYEGYNRFLKRIKTDYPDLHLECCASGGGRMSLSNEKGFDSFWMSDSHGIYSQLEIFKGALRRMPSRMLERWATIRSVEDFTPTYPVGGKEEKILLSATANWQRCEEASLDYIKNALVGGPIGISCDLTQVSDATLDSLAAFLKEYKAERDFWATSECRILCDTPTVTVLQFSDAALETVKIYMYTVHPNQEHVTVYPVVADGATYTLCHGNATSSCTSDELYENGVTLLANYQRISDTFTLKKV